jgi:pimeloyl-ACP methyl ester carboxylesterase
MAFSRHGYGRSGPARVPRSVDYMHDEALVVLPELLAALGVRAPILVGHSDGASIALIHAGTGHPVSGIVALAPHVMVETRTLDSIRAAREEYRHGRLRERLARHHDDPDAAFSGWNDIWLDPAFAGWSIEGHLTGVTTPLLCVQCADDPYGSLTQLDRIEAHVAGPVTRLVFPDGGHAPQRSHPGEVLHALSAFCGLLH